jgi:hypothetical protein
MQWYRIFYQIGSWAFILLGVGHLLTQWFAPRTAAQNAIFEAMRNFPMKLAGSDGNLYLYYLGFSSTMGVLLIAYGSLALVTASSCSHNLALVALHTGISVLIVLLSLKFFFIVPVVFMSVASLSYGLRLFLNRLMA